MLTLASPAKINLFLRVVKRRVDGYHELASLFQAIDLCDTLHFALSASDRLTCTDPSIPNDQSNLVLKAAALFRRKTGLTKGLTVHLEKRIPAQAGLGGGSSNAATTLWAFNQLCGCPATQNELAAWSGEIGSDITFFLSQGTAYCTGRGEILRPLGQFAKASLTIVKPPIGLSTPQVYRKVHVETLFQRDPEAVLASFLEGRPVYFNDLEIAAFEAAPELAMLKAQLQSSGFSHVLMSGSGSAFFCFGEGAFQEIPGVQFYQANFINREPDSWYAV